MDLWHTLDEIIATTNGSLDRTSFDVTDLRRRLADLLGRVTYGGETILITRQGIPMARLVPARRPK